MNVEMEQPDREEEENREFEEFFYKLLEGRQEIDPEYVRLVDEHFWELA